MFNQFIAGFGKIAVNFEAWLAIVFDEDPSGLGRYYFSIEMNPEQEKPVWYQTELQKMLFDADYNVCEWIEDDNLVF